MVTASVLRYIPYSIRKKYCCRDTIIFDRIAEYTAPNYLSELFYQFIRK